MATEGHCMSASLSSRSYSQVAGVLRAAGCVYAEDEARLLTGAARTEADLDDMVDRRVAGQPLEQVVGWAEFCGLRIVVDPAVFVPRRRTEFLVRQAAGSPAPAGRRSSSSICAAAPARWASRSPRRAARSSCTPPTSTRPPCTAPGATWPPPAAGCTRATSTTRCPPRCAAGSTSCWPTRPTCPPGRSGCCPPRPATTSRGWRSTAGPDGLDILRRVTAGAPGWLAPGGHLLFETSERQVAAAIAAVTRAGLTAQVARCAELTATVIIATRPVAPAGVG